MPVTLRQIPRDDSGVVKGQFRLRHRNPAFAEALGPVVFRKGVTVAPVTGVTLERTVAMIGHDLDIEPWPVEPARVAALPNDVRVEAPRHPAAPPAPPSAAAVVESAGGCEPAHEAESADDEDGDLPEDREGLVAIAAARGVKIESSWGRKRIRRAILESV
jgi:hypothetical protein